MRTRRILQIGTFLGLIAMASMSVAGDFHREGSLICSDCHVMHYSQTHGYNPDGSGTWTPMAGGPHGYLLRNDINQLCLACHDGQIWAPDVFEAHGNGYVRQAGALNEVGGNGLYPDATGHSLDYVGFTPGADPPLEFTEGLNCVNCHAAHGGGLAGNSYRNLGGFGTIPGPFTAISYTRGDVEGANPLTAWIHEDASSGTNANHYGFGGIAFNEIDPAESAYADFCKSCHTNFHGAVGGAEIGGSGIPPEHFHRHPAAEVNIGAHGGGHSRIDIFGNKTNQVQVMDPAGKKAGSYLDTDTDLTPSCMSCHKAHGNQNAFGLIFMFGTGAITEQGDDGTDARHLCQNCHTQGQ